MVERGLVVELPGTATRTDAAGIPCAARPATGYRHYDGPCRCFVGGPAPEYPPTRRPGPETTAA